MGEYIPGAPVNDEVRKHNQNLPGMGGVFNTVNLHLYHYAGNNPVKYVDPDGKEIMNTSTTLLMTSDTKTKLGGGKDLISEVGCVLTAYTRIANALSGKETSLADANAKAIALELFSNNNELTPEAGAKLINALLEGTGISVTYAGSVPVDNMTVFGICLKDLEKSPSKVFVTARVATTNSDGSQKYDHTVNINKSPVISGDITDMDNALNVKVNDTSGVRSQITNDVRENKIIKCDYFRVN